MFIVVAYWGTLVSFPGLWEFRGAQNLIEDFEQRCLDLLRRNLQEDCRNLVETSGLALLQGDMRVT